MAFSKDKCFQTIISDFAKIAVLFRSRFWFHFLPIQKRKVKREAQIEGNLRDNLES